MRESSGKQQGGNENAGCSGLLERRKRKTGVYHWAQQMAKRPSVCWRGTEVQWQASRPRCSASSTVDPHLAVWFQELDKDGVPLSTPLSSSLNINIGFHSPGKQLAAMIVGSWTSSSFRHGFTPRERRWCQSFYPVTKHASQSRLCLKGDTCSQLNPVITGLSSPFIHSIQIFTLQIYSDLIRLQSTYCPLPSR